MPETPTPPLCAKCPNWAHFRGESVSQRLRTIAELVLDVIKEEKSEDTKETISAIYSEMIERIKQFDLS